MYSDISFDILSRILSDLVFGIRSDLVFGIRSDLLPALYIYTCYLINALPFFSAFWVRSGNVFRGTLDGLGWRCSWHYFFELSKKMTFYMTFYLAWREGPRRALESMRASDSVRVRPVRKAPSGRLLSGHESGDASSQVRDLPVRRRKISSLLQRSGAGKMRRRRMRS